MKRLLLRAFAVYAGRAFGRLEAALRSPRRAQLATLGEILALARTEVVDYHAFRRLPLQTYEDLEATIVAGERGGPGLSLGRPFNYEPTSGSSGAAKLIPYTRELIGSFTTLFLCWAHDLLSLGPKLAGGRVYFSVSPQFQASGHGLADDSDYLAGLTGRLFRHFVLVPPTVKRLHRPEDFFRVVSLYLLAAPDLEVISIWSPSFLLRFLAYIHAERDSLRAQLAQSAITVAGQRFVYGQAPPATLAALGAAEPDWARLFPALKLISCWGANNARAGFSELRRRFPQVLVQEKGLLATEAPLTLPSLKYGQFLPLLTEVFFEFLDERGELLLIDELETGGRYEVVISQKSGLLRYRLGDMVEVTGRAGNTPCFHFCERSRNVSDLVGEKLNGQFVAGVVQQLVPEVYLCLVPDENRYLLFAEAPVDVEAIEAALLASPHYANARALGQLHPLEPILRPRLAQLLRRFFVERRGMQLGDIKDTYLYGRETSGELAAYLRGDPA